MATSPGRCHRRCRVQGSTDDLQLGGAVIRKMLVLAAVTLGIVSAAAPTADAGLNPVCGAAPGHGDAKIRKVGGAYDGAGEYACDLDSQHVKVVAPQGSTV